MDSGRVTGGGDIIAILSARVSELSKRVALLSAELDSAQKRVTIYEEHDATIQEAVSGALRAAYTIRQRAETTAEQILEQAREERRLILAEIERLQDERDRLQDEIATQRRSGLAAVGSMPLSSDAAMQELRSVANEALRGIFKEIVEDVRAKPATTPAETEEMPRAANTSSVIEEEDVMAPPAPPAPDLRAVEADRAAAERASAERDAAIARADGERAAAQRASEERAAAEARAAEERAAALRATEERAAAEARAEEQRAAAQRASEERAAAEAHAAAERAATERATQERAAAEARVAAENAAVERAVAEAKVASERATAERASQERTAAERATAERAAMDRASQERAAAERASAERAVAERAAVERAAAERDARERASAARAAAEQAAQERATAQERAAAERAAAPVQPPAPRPPLEVVHPAQEGRDIAPPRVEAATPTSDIQLVLSPVPSFPRLVEIERQIQALPNVRTLYVRDFRGGRATLAVQLRSSITAEEFATLLSGLREPRLRLTAGSRNTLELRVEGEAGVA